MTVEERYTRNIGTLTLDEMNTLQKKRVCIIGCGGLGGHILEMLTRIGILNITVVDGDVFSPSNLNRQVLCTEKNIGEYKAVHAVQRVKQINSAVTISAHTMFLNDDNAEAILHGHDVIVDALDNVPTRLLLEKHAEALNIPLIHGAIHGWMAQIAVIMPGDKILSRLYGTAAKAPTPTNPSFTPAFCASLQVSETVKLLCGKETLAKNQLLMFDLRDNSMFAITV